MLTIAWSVITPGTQAAPSNPLFRRPNGWKNPRRSSSIDRVRGNKDEPAALILMKNKD